MSGPADPPPRDAATVVLLRDGPAGPEAFLLQRPRAMTFAPGATVFPGGAVSDSDADPAIGRVGPAAADWSAALAADDVLAGALVGAAVRELFEEAGVLLAGPSGAATVGPADGPDWAEDRRALEAGEVSLATVLARRGLVLRADLLRPWGHWITPVGESRRYDTRFFVAALPAGQATVTVTGEADLVAWLRPADALAEVERGGRRMLPPTLVTLYELTTYRTVAEVLAAADRRDVATIQPKLRRAGDSGAEALLPDGRIIRVRP